MNCITAKERELCINPPSQCDNCFLFSNAIENTDFINVFIQPILIEMVILTYHMLDDTFIISAMNAQYSRLLFAPSLVEAASRDLRGMDGK